MQIAVVAATPFEIAPLLVFLENHFSKREDGAFVREQLTIVPIITGVGTSATSFQLGRTFAQWQPDLAINAGIAGAFDPLLAKGTVVHVVAEQFGDLGVEEADGKFTDLFELGLLDQNTPPFINAVLHNPEASKFDFLPNVKGLTVNKVHGNQMSIDAIIKKYPDVQVESMEGAAFFAACLLTGVAFLEIRSISNTVEPRNRANWDLPLSIKNLNDVLIAIIGSF